MVVNQFEALLQELGQILKIPLHPDKTHSCLIKLKEGVSVQLEIDRPGDSLLFGIDVADVPPGKYRENLFKEALRANGSPSPRYGTLAYSRKTGHLVLFERLPLKDLNGDKVAEFLKPFVMKAKVWKDAIIRGEVPVIQGSGAHPNKNIGMFGLRP